MIPLLLAIVAACPVGVHPAACEAVEVCVADSYKPRPAEAGVTAGEAALASERDAYRACAYAAAARARGEEQAAKTLTSSAVPECPAAVPCECPAVPVCPSLLEQLAVGTAVCALCAGGGAAAGAGVAARGCP